MALYASQHLHAVIEKKLEEKQIRQNKEQPSDEDIFKILEQSFFELDSELENHIKDGSTAVVALLVGERGYIAGAGDTRAVLGTTKGAKRLSTDHKPDLPSEEKRIKDLGKACKKTLPFIKKKHTSSSKQTICDLSKTISCLRLLKSFFPK